MGSPANAELLLLLPPAAAPLAGVSAAVRLLTTRLLTSSAADMRISSVKRFRWRRRAAGCLGGREG